MGKPTTSLGWITRIVVLLAQALAIAAVIVDVYLFSYNWVQPDGRLNWLPLMYLAGANVCCLYVVWVVWWQPAVAWLRHAMWVALGIYAGFIIAGMWSIGFYFAPSWLLLVLVALVEAVCHRTRILTLIGSIALMFGVGIAQTAYLILLPRILYSQ